MPARIAMETLVAGEQVTLAVLGMGVIECDSEDEDERVSEAYEALDDDDDPASMVLAYYEHEVEEHPWMEGPLLPFMELMEHPDEDLQEKVRHVARYLSKQSISGAEAAANADLLGRVMQELGHQAARRKYGPGLFSPQIVNTFEGLMDPETVLRLGTFCDAWCGSGQRAIGLATAVKMLGRDPGDIEWTLMDADPMCRAITACNVRAFGIGENVVIADGKDHKEAWLAARASGMAPDLWHFDVPEDVVRGERDAPPLTRRQRRARA